ncbi:major histocompatibility complex class I-related gene protein-like isoform X2 [Echeneis naucrates]|uniref:major histocompatibility complex class I-related gene protein-like isoform X2 n=1 Tax=Echeneis naucrates TaxID=173247 RepID=UPI0011143A3B|nr:major histocompatibility complex class I-related gene protein-like isoform X2 [Echeneis naucrates]
MKAVFLFMLLIYGSTGAKHSLKYFFTASSGLPGFPEVLAVALVDDQPLGHCDTGTKRLEIEPVWMKRYFEQNPSQLEWYNQQCFEFQPNFFKARIYDLKQRFNQSGDVHILQRATGCEWDDMTGKLTGFHQYGYDGDDFISLATDTFTWVAPKDQAVSTKLRWDTDTARIKYNSNFLTELCPAWLKVYVNSGKNTLMRTDRPSVFLLQKSSSSPVSCFATGFYPNKAVLFWRKDGDDLHDNVEEGEILPNPDGTFQKSSDLDLSSVRPEDWGKYECVFQLDGLKDDIITKLDQSVIRSNSDDVDALTVSIIIALVLLAVVLSAIAGFIFIKWRKAKITRSRSDTSELSAALNPALQIQ